MRLDLGQREGTLTLDHPTDRGALTLRMMVQLADAVATLERWEGAALVVRSTCSRVFCAGAHLGDLQDALHDPAGAEILNKSMTGVLTRLQRVPCLTVAAWDGLAIGGGAELMCSLDVRVGGIEPRLRFVHVARGLVPGWGGAGRLAGIVGRSRALQLLVQAETLDATALIRLGLLNSHRAAPALEVARAWTASLAGRDVAALRGAKALIDHAGDPDAEAQVFTSLWQGARLSGRA